MKMRMLPLDHHLELVAGALHQAADLVVVHLKHLHIQNFMLSFYSHVMCMFPAQFVPRKCVRLHLRIIFFSNRSKSASQKNINLATKLLDSQETLTSFHLSLFKFVSLSHHQLNIN